MQSMTVFLGGKCQECAKVRDGGLHEDSRRPVEDVISRGCKLLGSLEEVCLHVQDTIRVLNLTGLRV